jgi:hypothetical protein
MTGMGYANHNNIFPNHIPPPLRARGANAPSRFRSISSHRPRDLRSETTLRFPMVAQRGSLSQESSWFGLPIVGLVIMVWTLCDRQTREMAQIQSVLSSPAFVNVDLACERAYYIGWMSMLLWRQGRVTQYYIEGHVSSSDDRDRLAVQIECLALSRGYTIDVEIGP